MFIRVSRNVGGDWRALGERPYGLYVSRHARAIYAAKAGYYGRTKKRPCGEFVMSFR